MLAGLGRLHGRDRAWDDGGVPAVELRSFEQASDVAHGIIVRSPSKVWRREIRVLALAGFNRGKCLRYSGTMKATCVVYNPAEIPIEHIPDPNYSIHPRISKGTL
jgi:hypothetical protein